MVRSLAPFLYVQVVLPLLSIPWLTKISLSVGKGASEGRGSSSKFAQLLKKAANDKILSLEAITFLSCLNINVLNAY